MFGMVSCSQYPSPFKKNPVMHTEQPLATVADNVAEFLRMKQFGVVTERQLMSL
jgi:hypothetical protein